MTEHRRYFQKVMDRLNLGRRGAGAALETSKSQLCTRSEEGSSGMIRAVRRRSMVCVPLGERPRLFSQTLCSDAGCRFSLLEVGWQRRHP